MSPAVLRSACGHTIPGALSISTGADPDWNRGSCHSAPTYLSRFPGSKVPRLVRLRFRPLQTDCLPVSDSPAIREAKKELRAQAQRRRSEVHEGELGHAGEELCSHGIAALAGRPPGIVSAYHPYESEIDCLPLLDALRQAGWRIALPVVLSRAQPLEFRAWLPDDTLVPGSFGIPIPREGTAVVEPDVMFVPMLAFDRFGYRLGYGGGFYDRTLALARQDREVTAIGIAYAAQQIDRCPTGDYDQPLDGIITQNGPVTLVAAGQKG